MRAIFQKKDKKGQNIWKFGQKFENILKKGSLMCATITFMKQLEYTLNSEPALSKEWVELWSSFFACGEEAIEVTHLFNHFRWIWSDMHKVVSDTNVNSKVTYVHYMFLIHFLLLIIIYILFKFQMLDEKNLKIGFCLYFLHILKC